MARNNADTKKSQTASSELVKRILFVLGAIIVFRIGSYVPVPGIDSAGLTAFVEDQKNSILGLFNMFGGGALSRASVFALGIMPYISASIIMQILTFVHPHLQQLKKEGENGRRKISQYTRYGTVVLAAIQSFGIAMGLQSSMAQYVLTPGPAFILTTVVSLITGTMFLMWLGEQITERGVGNGISLIIFSGIVAGLPSAIGETLNQAKDGTISILIVLVIALIALAVIGFVVFMERAQRRIVINYARRQQGRKMMQGQTTHLPLKINMAGVIPPIFASSIILFPNTIATWLGQSEGFGWLQDISYYMSPGQPLYVLFYAVGIIFFCFFYTALVFNPRETAENLKRSGAFIPGIRPGEQTSKYIDKVMTRLTLAGSLYIAGVCLMPEFLILTMKVGFHFGGTSLLIVVVVIMDFMAQIQTHMMSHQYDSILKKANLKGSTPGGAVR